MTTTENMNKSVWFLWSQTATTLNGLKTSGTKRTCNLRNDGSFSIDLSSLQYGTTYYYVACAKVYDKEFYGEVQSFSSISIDDIITLETVEASDIGFGQATLNGSLFLNTTETLNKTVWFLCSETASSLESLKNSCTQRLSTLQDDGTYSLPIGLHSGTTYYYVACARVKDKDFFGDVKHFSTNDLSRYVSITTRTTSDITHNSAILSGSLSVNTTEDLNKSVWFLWSKTAKTIDELKTTGTKVSSALDDSGLFNSAISKLEYDTDYYYISVAKVYDREFYSEIAKFRTNDLQATVNALPATNITQFKASLNGNLVVHSEGDYSKDAWFLYSETAKTEDELKSKGQRVSATLQSDGSFKCNLSDLKCNTNYYYIAVARVNDREFYGSSVNSFTTSDYSALVTTSSASDITEFKAILNGSLMVESEDDLSKSVWFLYSKTAKTAEDLKSKGQKVLATLQSDGSFKSSINGLIYNTNYNYIAVAKVHDREYCGSVKCFNTRDIEATVVTQATTEVKWSRSTLNASLTTNNIEPLNTTVWFIYSDIACSLDELLLSGITIAAILNENGQFSINLTGLTSNKTYYYVAGARVHDKEFYGNVVDFKADVIPNGAIDMGLSVLWAESNLCLSGLCGYSQEYGDYYAWGETEPKSEYTYASYTLCKGSYTTMTKYCTDSAYGTTDKRTDFKDYGYLDDAARDILGGKWRVPRKEEWDELSENCTWVWTDNYNETGIAGRIATSNVTGYTDKSIFLPAGGRQHAASIIGLGTKANYWASSIYTSQQNLANAFSFTSTKVGWDLGTRCDGLLIRPVMK